MSWKNKVVPVQNVPTKPGHLRELRSEHKSKKKEDIKKKTRWVRNYCSRPQLLRQVRPLKVAQRTQTEKKRHQEVKRWVGNWLFQLYSETSRKNKDITKKSRWVRNWLFQVRMFRQSRELHREHMSKNKIRKKMGQKLVVPVQNVPTKPGRLREFHREHKSRKKEDTKKKTRQIRNWLFQLRMFQKARPFERVAQRTQVEKQEGIKKKK
ncbi:hypothetical protein DFJ73DRAFT_959361 [Zopfochytrium polystomum]|nr:hypothetical protein DFJ73DRAFT_959361 [Zopfochytrium polystomum]